MGGGPGMHYWQARAMIGGERVWSLLDPLVPMRAHPNSFISYTFLIVGHS